MTDQRELDLGEREIALDTIRRIDSAVSPTEPSAGSCLCRERGWQCRHEPSYEERLEQIFRGGRQPGEDG